MVSGMQSILQLLLKIYLRMSPINEKRQHSIKMLSVDLHTDEERFLKNLVSTKNIKSERGKLQDLLHKKEIFFTQISLLYKYIFLIETFALYFNQSLSHYMSFVACCRPCNLLWTS